MKKIVGILAAAAIATSVFAADVSATAKVKSTLFKYNAKELTSKDDKGVVSVTAKEGQMSAFGKIENNQTAGHITLFTLSTSTDNAGGTVKYWGNGSTVDFGGFTVWYKPADNIKLSYLENALELFGDKYNGYYAHDVAKQAAGYGLQIAADAVTVDVVLQDDFVTKADKDAKVALKQLGAKIGYSADFGSLAFIFAANNTFKAFDIGAGFSGNFGDVGVVFNAGAKIDTDNNTKKIGINPSAGGSIDALSWAIDVPVTLDIGNDPSVGTNAKVAYALDPVTVTGYFEDGNFLAAGDFAATIGAKLNGSVGAASWEINCSYKTADKEFNVGLETGIGF